MFAWLQKISEILRILLILRRESTSKKRLKSSVISTCFVYISILSILKNGVDMHMLAKPKRSWEVKF